MPKRVQAAIAVKGSNINILSVCDKKYCYNTAYGYIWRYIDDNDYSYKHKSEKVILQIDIKTNKIINKFESITKAAKFVNVSISSISAALTGKSKTCKNFIWKYDAIER